MSNENLASPLAGVRVLDLSRVLAGPLCSQILADLGAEVVKIESPAGDDTRQWGPPFHGDFSAYFLSVNRGKQSVVLDLSKPAALEVLRDLIRRSDVLLQNFLPHSCERFGLTRERLAEINPRLTSCSITGFGETGPWKDVPGYDFVVQALSGLMSITGEPDGAPMKVGVAIADVLTGLYAAVSVLAGLAARPRGSTAVGRHFDLSLLDCTVASLVNVAQAYLVTGRTPKRYGNAHPHIVPYECFATADGWIVLAVGNDRQWRRFCNAVGHPDWADDIRFATNPARVANRDALIALLRPFLQQRGTTEWDALFAEHDIPHAPVLTLAETMSHPQMAARGMIREALAGETQPLKLVASPIHGFPPLCAEPPPPPVLGQHTVDVLRDLLGYDETRIASLRRLGAIP